MMIRPVNVPVDEAAEGAALTNPPKPPPMITTMGIFPGHSSLQSDLHTIQALTETVLHVSSNAEWSPETLSMMRR